MADLLLEPLRYPFFVRALAAGIVVGAMCGAVGVFVVLRRMSYIGHGLSHSVLGGVAVATAAGVSMYVGAAVATLLSALLIDRVARRDGLHADAAIGIVTTATFALGVAVVSRGWGGRVSLESLLFGNILGVQAGDVAVAGGAAVVFALLLFTFYKPLVFTTFDGAVAAVQGVRVGAVEVLFNVLVAGVIIVSVRILGVLLIAAAVVIPAAIARLISRSFGRMLLVATTVSILGTTLGLYLSFHIDVASGASIVLTETAIFTLLVSATGLLARSTLRTARRRAADPSASDEDAPARRSATAAGAPPPA